jgi:hypothetical protein
MFFGSFCQKRFIEKPTVGEAPILPSFCNSSRRNEDEAVLRVRNRDADLSVHGQRTFFPFHAEQLRAVVPLL